jgi:Toastrack DUF4097
MVCVRERALGGTTVLIFLVAGVAAGAEGSFDRTLQVSGPVELEVTTRSGGIHVRVGEAGAVRVHGIARASGGANAMQRLRQLEANPPIEQSGNVIRIGRLEDSELGRNVSIAYDLVVPADTQLAAESGSGDLSAEGIRGPLRASTGSGGLRFADLEGDVHASTGSGDIEIESVRGSVQATTGSGSIRGSGIAGEVSLVTGSGDVRLEQATPGSVKVRTGSGQIELLNLRGPVQAETGDGSIKAEGDLAGDWHLETGSGGITARVPPGAGFELRAHTGSGSISTGRTLAVEAKHSRNDWRGRVGAGGHLLELETGSGNIRID